MALTQMGQAEKKTKVITEHIAPAHLGWAEKQNKIKQNTVYINKIPYNPDCVSHSNFPTLHNLQPTEIPKQISGEDLSNADALPRCCRLTEYLWA